MITKIIGIGVGAIVVTISWLLAWRYLGWQKALLVIIAVVLIDVDHFLFTNQLGFLQVPQPGMKIFHAFHTIEFLIVVVAINLMDGRRGRSGIAWLLPRPSDYSKTWYYYLAWIARFLLLGMAIHYLMDLFIYTIMGKWNYYDLSVIHYLLSI
ncbi:MAG: hypothetical protein ONB05_05110 [candidate division KSB1 bacterium]|nr:hypothetical protein [candidate division KSB1 bacterium]